MSSKKTKNTHKEVLFNMINQSEFKSQLINWFVSQPAFIQALCSDFGWEV